MLKKIKKILHLKGMYRIIVFFLVNRVFIRMHGVSCNIKRNLLNSIGCNIGENTTIVGPIECAGILITGKNCWLGKNLKVNGNGTVIIGNNCDLGPEVTFQTGGHQIGDVVRRAGNGETYTQIIGDGTWIGGRVTICNNTTVGKSCIIAGCACVIKDVPDNSLVGGVPAKLIRRL